MKGFISSASAQNPLGFTMSDENIKRVLFICKKYNVKVIEDDVYGEISFLKKRPKTYKYFDKDEIVTYCSSFSKFLGPGLRMGWCIPSNGKVGAIKYLKHKLSLNLATNSLTQYAVSAVLQNENLLKVGKTLSSYYQNNIQIYSNFLHSELGSKISLSNPSGSYFLWARVEGMDSLKAYQRAKAQNISFAPGPIFSATRLYNNYLRINCAHEYDEKTHLNLNKLCQILAKD